MSKQTTLSLDGLNDHQFIILSMEAAEALNWQSQFINEETLRIGTKKGWSSYGEDITVSITGDTAQVVSKLKQWQVSDFGKNAKNILAFTEKLSALRGNFSPEELTEKYNRLKAEQGAYLADFQARLNENKLTATEKISLGMGGHTVTYTLIALNLLVFIAMAISGVNVFSPETADILKWGGNFKPVTLGGQYWRLLSCVFVHIGLIHVLFNMYALYFLGAYLEPLLGKWKFLLVFLCTGILASVASLWWNGERVSAGASGAIFGLGGVFIALLTTNLIDGAARKSLLQSMAIFVGYNLLYGTKQGIDNAAHIGGLLSGVAFGYILYAGIKKPAAEKSTLLAVVAISLFISLGYVFTAKDDTLAYQQALDKFSVLEEKAISPLQKPMSDSVLIDRLTRVSAPAWKEAKDILTKTNSFKLSPLLAQQRKMIGDYIDLREKETNLLIHIHSNQQQPSDTSDLREVELSIKSKIDALQNLLKK